MQHGQALHSAGQRTRTAILLFGRPGTGKTLLTRYLITQSAGYTTIMLQGFQHGLVRDAFRLARYLEPTLIVIEDVDLIAVKRQSTRRGSILLHELLDELDGLAPESRCAVIMTTNRPDVLEPALAARPGRVTQAIEFPMPDARQREQLLRLFLSRTDANNLNFEQWAERTQGASPAFLEELVRRAVLIVIQNATKTLEIPVIRDTDMDAAMREIVTLGGPLTQQLLGHAQHSQPIS